MYIVLFSKFVDIYHLRILFRSLLTIHTYVVTAYMKVIEMCV